MIHRPLRAGRSVLRPRALLLALLVGGLLAWPASLPAQPAIPDTILVCDSADDTVIRLADHDGDGVFSPVEVTPYYDDSSPGPDLSTPAHLVAWNDGFLLADGGTLDAILRLVDLNADGDALDAGEVLPFYDDSSAGPDLSTPNGMVIGVDGALYVVDDGSTVRAVLRLVDLDGNGDALGAGEVSIFYDETAALVVTDPESIAAAPDGSIYIGDTATGRVVRLIDLDGDGTALGAGEATVLYDATGPVPLADLDAIQVDASGRVYVVDEDTGTILRLEDLDGDGDALDPGEMLVFHDGTAPGALVSDPNDAWLLGPGRILVVDGALDALVLLEDLDGDGAALAPGETTIVFEDGGMTFSTPSGVTGTADPAPPASVTIDTVSPPVGDAVGGTVVMITGAGWTALDPVSVDFAGVPVPATVISTTELSVLAPAHPPALVDVGVTTAGASAVSAGAFRFQHRFRRGDVTGDGVFGLADPIVLISYLFVPGAPTPGCLDAADADDDDVLELEDAVRVLGHLFAGGPPPVSPFPERGFDPTPLGPGCEVPGP